MYQHNKIRSIKQKVRTRAILGSRMCGPLYTLLTLVTLHRKKGSCSLFVVPETTNLLRPILTVCFREIALKFDTFVYVVFFL